MDRPPGLPDSTRDHSVWVALTDYTVGPEDASLSFTDRLARENGWTSAHGARVMAEYRRFCFLAATATHPVTPSDAVDQAWHLHLTYSRDYWQRFCPLLGRPLHHEPTAGGPAEQHRFFDQYAHTLLAYETAFGVAPPADLWPDAAQRLLRDPRARRVHPRDMLILPRDPALLALGALVLLVVLLLVRSFADVAV